MDFQLSDELIELKEMVRHFVEKNVEPTAGQIEEDDHVPDTVLKKAMEMGLFGLGIPEAYGGLGLSMLEKCALFEELGRTINGFTTILGAHNGIGSVGIVELASNRPTHELPASTKAHRKSRKILSHHNLAKTMTKLIKKIDPIFT